MASPMSSIAGIGIDIIETARFSVYKQNRRAAFLKKVFTSKELDYCFSFSDPVTHLAGTFAAKEAVVKALKAKRVSVLDIEIRRGKDGEPIVFKKNKLHKDIPISISHTKNVACAIAIHCN